MSFGHKQYYIRGFTKSILIAHEILTFPEPLQISWAIRSLLFGVDLILCVSKSSKVFKVDF